MNILLLDDDPYVLELLALQLKRLGLRERGFAAAIRCRRGSEALELLERDRGAIGLIFCDLQMPEMDGVEFLRHLGRIDYRGELVLVSGENERVIHTAERLARAHRLQVLGTLHKPVMLDQLKAALDGIRRQAEPPPPDPIGSRYSADELRRAIEHGELVNYYQPKVELESGRAVGVETLVRWRHPQDGLVLPGQFIALAEEHAVIDELTRAVLRMALADARRWQDAGHALHLAVNVSMANLAELDFPEWIDREAAWAGVPLPRLTLEVTESRLMNDPLVQLDILTRLRLRRVGLSIDDFGTGYSSLAQLRDLPFNELKIDRGFVHGACRDASLAAMLQASLAMARRLALQTVAEGVEDAGDWEHLQRCGCDMAQGYFIGAPMPAARLPIWLAEWNARRDSVAASA